MGYVGMIDSDPRIQNAFLNLSREVESYLPLPKAFIVYRCYDFSLPCYSTKAKLNELFALQSLDIAMDLARLKFDPEILSGALLYYPVSSGNISMIDYSDNSIREPPTGKRTKSSTIRQVSHQLPLLTRYVTTGKEPVQSISRKMAYSIKQLGGIGNILDVYLPWKQPSNQSILEGRVQEYHLDPKKTANISLKALLSFGPDAIVAHAIGRLHALKYLEMLPLDPSVCEMIAREALLVHATAIEMLGVWSIKWQLEDLALKVSDPENYRYIASALNEKRKIREEIIENAILILSKSLQTHGIQARIKGRPKHIYSLYAKIVRLGQSIDGINDTLGIRVIVKTKEECYRVLELIHHMWKPVKGVYGDKLFRDWIASPKPNLYQSLHTTVHYTEYNHRPLEVQIRTEEMDEIAEYGVAAHWIYKRAGNSAKAQKEYSLYVNRMAEFRRSLEQRQDES